MPISAAAVSLVACEILAATLDFTGYQSGQQAVGRGDAQATATGAAVRMPAPRRTMSGGSTMNLAISEGADSDGRHSGKWPAEEVACRQAAAVARVARARVRVAEGEREGDRGARPVSPTA